HPVPQEEMPTGVALRAGGGIKTDERDHQPEAADDQTLGHALAAERSNEGDAENGEEEELRRAERQNDGFQNFQRGAKENRAENAARKRSPEAGAERPT